MIFVVADLGVLVRVLNVVGVVVEEEVVAVVIEEEEFVVVWRMKQLCLEAGQLKLQQKSVVLTVELNCLIPACSQRGYCREL